MVLIGFCSDGPLQTFLRNYKFFAKPMFIGNFTLFVPMLAATAGHSLTHDPMGTKHFFSQTTWTIDPMGKWLPPQDSNAFSETTNIIKAKLYMNVHWMVLYKLYAFCSDMKFKMAATAGLSLTLDPMGKCFKMLLL